MTDASEYDGDQSPWDIMEKSEKSDYTTKVVTASIMASLSIVMSASASAIPRLPGWGIALFDPVSIVWIVAFLIGGPAVGAVTTGVGTIALFFFDPTGIGPIFKLLATLPMIVFLGLGIQLFGKDKVGGDLSSPKLYLMMSFVGYLVRLAIMIPMNIILVPIFFGPLPVDFIIQYTLILNTLQSFWDVLVPYVIVHKTPVYEYFGMW